MPRPCALPRTATPAALTHTRRLQLRTVVLHDRSGESWGWGALSSDFEGGDAGVAAVAAAAAAPSAMEN